MKEEIEIIDLDLELVKMSAYEEEKLKELDETNLEEFKQKCYNLEILSQYMDLNENIFEEINDILVDTENKEWFRYSDALEQIREILNSRIYLLDAISNPKSERDNNLCL